MDGADSQSAQLPDAHPTFFAPMVRQGQEIGRFLETVGLTVVGSSGATSHCAVAAACGSMDGRPTRIIRRPMVRPGHDSRTVR